MIFAYGGLCNRIRVILSGLALEPEKPLVIVWKKEPAVSGSHFLEVFQPIPKVKFVDTFVGKEIRKECHELCPESEWRHLVKLLKPKPPVQSRINKVLDKLTRPFIAVHVRRTDLIPRLDDPGYDSFFKFIDDFLTARHRSNSHTNIFGSDKYEPNVYVATDNAETLAVFATRYGSRLVSCGARYAPTRKRQTELADAVVDMFVCAEAEHFMGTPKSSFSEMIEQIRTV